jgi:hypothetical protein
MNSEVTAKARRRAGFYRMVLRDPRAIDDYQAAIRMYQGLADRAPARVWLRTDLISTSREFAHWMETYGHADDAEDATRRALTVAQGLLDDRAADLPCFSKNLVEPFHDLAWTLVRRPSSRPDDPSLALRLARRLIVWYPERAASWTILAMAEYRVGDNSAAARALRKSMKLHPDGGDRRDWLILSLIQRRDGDEESARAWYDRAITDMAENVTDCPPDSEALLLRAEAASVLGLASDPSTLAGTPTIPRLCPRPFRASL